MLWCVELVNRGGELERVMQQPESDAEAEMQGHFLDRTERSKIRDALSPLKENWIISVPTASFIVYGSVILGWVVVTAFGVAAFF